MACNEKKKTGEKKKVIYYECIEISLNVRLIIVMYIEEKNRSAFWIKELQSQLCIWEINIFTVIPSMDMEQC